MEHKTAGIKLTESNARYTLLALRELDQKLEKLAHDEDIDEDERFLHANDLIECSRALDKIKKTCVDVFGEQVLEHGHDPI